MRVGMDELVAVQQRAGRGKRGADRIGGFVDMHAGEQRHGGVVGAVALHGIRHRDAVGAAEEEIILAMAGRHMHDAGAGLGGDEIAQHHRHVEGIARILAGQRMVEFLALQLGALEQAQDTMSGDAGLLDKIVQQRFGDDQLFADAGEAALCHVIDRDQRVIELGTGGEAAIAGDGPGRRRPDDDRQRPPDRLVIARRRWETAHRSPCLFCRDTRPRLRPGRFFPPGSTSPGAGRDTARR